MCVLGSAHALGDVAHSQLLSALSATRAILSYQPCCQLRALFLAMSHPFLARRHEFSANQKAPGCQAPKTEKSKLRTRIPPARLGLAETSPSSRFGFSGV